MLYPILLSLIQFHLNNCQFQQPTITHGFLKHLIPVKPIAPTDVHRQGYFLQNPQLTLPLPNIGGGPTEFFPFHPQQNPYLVNPLHKPEFINEVWSPYYNAPSSFHPPMGQPTILGTNYPSFEQPGTKSPFREFLDTKLLNWPLLNKTSNNRPIALLITGKKENGKNLFRNLLLHVDLDESQIKALKPDVLEQLNLFSPHDSKWYRLLAERVLKKFKSRYNLVLVPNQPTIKDMFQRREEVIWNNGRNSEDFQIDIEKMINPRK